MRGSKGGKFWVISLGLAVLSATVPWRGRAQEPVAGEGSTQEPAPGVPGPEHQVLMELLDSWV